MATLESGLILNQQSNRPIDDDHSDTPTVIIGKASNPFANVSLEACGVHQTPADEGTVETSEVQTLTQRLRSAGQANREAEDVVPEYGLFSLRVLAYSHPEWVIEQAIELAGRRADLDGTRLAVIVSILKRRPNELVEFSTMLAAEGVSRLRMFIAVLRAQVREPSLRAACLVPWLDA